MRASGLVFAGLVLCVAALVAADTIPTCGSLNVQVRRTQLPVGELEFDDYSFTYASKSNQVVFALTLGGALWRSDNEGDSWVKQSTNQIMPGIEQSSRLWAIIHGAYDPIRPTGFATVYFMSSDKLWVSDDGGATYRVSTLAPKNIYTIVPHPSLKDYALASNTTQTYYTQDAGRTWRLLVTQAKVTGVRWGFHGDHEHRIYAMTTPAGKSISDLVLSDDFFVSYHAIKTSIWWFGLRNADDIIALQRQTKGDVLVLSDDAGKTWREAAFPAEGDADLLGWQLFDTSEDSIFIGLIRGFNPVWSDVFKSNSYGKDFSTAIRNVHNPDFTRFHSVEGIYVANQYQLSEGKPLYRDDIRTKISYNKGGRWHDLRPPATEFDGRPYNCSLADGCALHLHGYSTGGTFGWFYSTPAALGIMFANGNVGPKLSSHKDDINAYFSFDAGLTWEEIGDGPYVPEFGDLGGIVLAVDQDDPVNHVLFHDGKMNGGKTVWSKCQFNDGSLEKIRNIRVSPNWDSKQFIMYGTTFDKQTVVYSLDFANIMQSCGPNDFEEWTPTDEHGGCVLGEKDTYKRRKEGVRCWYNENFKRLQKTENCSCTKEDWECDFCFEYDNVLESCVFVCPHDPTTFPVPPLGACTQAKDAYFTTNSGWRKVEDDMCDATMPHSVNKPNGLVSCSILHTTPHAAPVSSPTNESSPNAVATPTGVNPVAVGVIVAVVIIVLVAVVVFLLITQSNTVRAFFGLAPRGTPAESNYARVNTSLEVEDEEEEEDHELGLQDKPE